MYVLTHTALESSILVPQTQIAIFWLGGLFLILNCMHCLYILENNSLLEVSFANIFSHFLGCLLAFFFFKGFLHFTKPLKLNWVSFVYFFCFYFYYYRKQIQKIVLWFMSKSVLPMFLSRSFMVSGLTVWFLIHFELIFAYDIRKYSNFTLLHVAIEFSQHNLLKRLSFLHFTFLPSLL